MSSRLLLACREQYKKICERYQLSLDILLHNFAIVDLDAKYGRMSQILAYGYSQTENQMCGDEFYKYIAN